VPCGRTLHVIAGSKLGGAVTDVQLELDLAGSHTDATTAFREWMLSLPPTPWADEAARHG